MSLDNIKNKLNEAIDYFKSFNIINTVYLHGSYAKETQHPNSDIDFAVLLKGSSYLNTEKILIISSKLEIIFNRKVDLGVLSSKNLIYAKEVIEHGKPVFCRNKFEKEMFEATMLSMYLNFQLERKEILNAYRT